MKARIIQNTSASVQQEFLKKWLKGLRTYSKSNNEMTLLERKRTIKLSADVAMASTRNIATTRWSRATMAGAATDAAGGATMVEQILTQQEFSDILTIKSRKKNLQRVHNVVTCAKKKVKKARRGVVPSRLKSISTAKKVVKNRTSVLKELLPGGHDMDEVCLLRETLDYIASLRIQVDVMRHIASAAEEGLKTQETLM